MGYQTWPATVTRANTDIERLARKIDHAAHNFQSQFKIAMGGLKRPEARCQPIGREGVDRGNREQVLGCPWYGHAKSMYGPGYVL